jgi:predicted phage terminase large subunit-like protein
MKDELLELLGSMSDEQLSLVIERLPEGQREHLAQIADEYGNAIKRDRGQKRFMEFVKLMWPSFISGRHHEIMSEAFERVASGELKRLIINMPPRHTKSEFASYLLPAWFLGKFPHKKIIQSSNTAELAVGFGRKVRNLVDSDTYAKVFPNVALRHDSKAAGRWSTNANGEYFAIGVGGTVTGKGADLLIIDDPHSEQEAKLAESDPSIFDSVYEWYTSGPRQRLQPGGSIVVVMCMTGDTPVLMACGAEKRLDQIRPGDLIATFDEGRLTKAKVNNWQSSGVDSIYKIQTKSGRILRANARHPFLVMNEGVLEWTMLYQLRVGDELVATKAALDLQGQRQSPVFAEPAWQKSPTTEETLTLHAVRLGFMANGRANFANVVSRFTVGECAWFVTERNTPHQNQRQRKTGQEGLSTATESPLSSMRVWLRSAKTAVMSVVKSLLPPTPALIGAGSCASTMIMQQERSEGFSATTATWQLDTERRLMYLNALRRTSDFTTDQIVSIEPDGEEEVFDVEIDRTENFIANGFVSHNTRWAKRDLTGRVMKDSVQRGGDEWELIEFPAILPSDKPLWPQFWSYEELSALRAELPNSKWQAQYQQSPTSESAAIVKREWWRIWNEDSPPPCNFRLMAWDTAFEKSNRADYSACTIWGVFYHPDDNGLEQANIILLNAVRDRVEFPELKRMVLRLTKDWEPDSTIIEKKASGAPLIYELRAMGVPVQEFTPVKGNDKITRLNAVSDLFASGRVWAPNTNWAEEVIDEVASFPSGDHDDYVDTVSLALMRFRKGGYIRSDLDENDDKVKSLRRRPVYY